MTVYMVISLPTIPYTYIYDRIYMVLANPTCNPLTTALPEPVQSVRMTG